MLNLFYRLVLLSLIVLAAVSSPALADWNTAQGDQQRTGLSPYSVDESSLRLAWNYDLNISGQRATASSPAIYGTTVYAVWGAGVAATRAVTSHDINTGALNWTYVLPGASRTTPAVFNVDTTGLGDYAVLVFVGNGSTTSGTAGVDAVRASDGTLFKRYLLVLGEGGVVGSTPVLVDTGGTAGPDLLIAGTSRLSSLRAWGITGPGTAVSSPWFITGLDVPSTSQILNSLALSADDSIVYAATADFGSTWDGYVHARDTRTGAAVGAFLRTERGFVANPTVANSNTVIASTFNSGPALGFARRVYVLDRTLTTFAQTGFDNGAQRGGGALYYDVSGDTFYYNTSEELHLLIAWSVTGMRSGGGLVALSPLCSSPASPLAISDNGTGFVSAGFPGGGFGGGPGDNDVNIFDASTGFLLWNKPYVGANTVTGFQRSNAAIADSASNDSDVVVILQDAAGYLIGLKQDATPYARFEQEPVVSVGDPCPVLMMNISLPFNGTDTDTAEFINIGTASGSYSVSTDSVLAAANLPKVTVRYTDVSRSRKDMALKVSDDLTATAKGKFMAKDIAGFYSEIPDEQAEEFLLAGSFQSKHRASAFASTVPPAWLTITDLTSGGPIPFASTARIEAVASSASLPLGQYFAEIHLSVTPGDPDPDYYGGTDVVYPITLTVGYVLEEVVVSTPVLYKLVTNYSALGASPGNTADPNNFEWNGTNELYDGTIVLANGDSTLVMDVFDHAQLGVLPDSSIGVTTLTDSTLTYTRYIDNTGLGVKVNQYTKTFNDPEKAGFVLYRLVITNISDSLIPNLGVGLYFDWDVGNSSTNLGDMDTTYKIFYQFDNASPALRFGVMSIPFNSPVYGYALIDNPTYVYAPADIADSMWTLMSRGTFTTVGSGGPDDHSMVLTLSLANLDSGATRVEEFALFGYDTTLVSTDSLARLINATATDVKDISPQTANLPKSYELNQNFPNPFNANTQIRFAVPKESHVNLAVYNILGRRVKTLVDERLTPGYKQIVWDGTNESGDQVASGVYFYRIWSSDLQITKKMVLMK